MTTNLQYKDCIEACIHTMNACNICYVSCLKEYDIAELRDCITLTRECAEACSFAAEAMTRMSQYSSDIVSVLIRICEDCAEECEKHEHTHCQECAESCRRCAEICREMCCVA